MKHTNTLHVEEEKIMEKYKDLFRNNKNSVLVDRTYMKPILKCSISNGEQIAGFKDLRTGEFHGILFIKKPTDLDWFMDEYDIDIISKEY